MQKELAGQPQVIRAYQRDEEYKQWLRFSVLESLELAVPYRLIHKWRAEIMAAADLVYFGLTTLRGKQTLGEEYCNIRPSYRGDKGRFPSLTRRAVFFALTILGPYLINKLVKHNEQRVAQLVFEQSQLLQPPDDDSPPDLKQMLKAAFLTEIIPESLQSLIKNFEHLHLALFFIWRRYYELARRLSGITYTKNRPND